jgi:hypothetical protein
MAKDGVIDEDKLVAEGVLHLFSITPDEPGNLSA